MNNRDVIGKYVNDNRNEQMIASEGLMNALDNDDDEAKRYWASKIKWEPEILRAVKAILGAEGLRQAGYCTELADKAYGPDWLDRPELDDL